MPSGRGVGTLLVRVEVLGNEASENRNGRLAYELEEMVEILRHLDSAADNAATARDPYNQAIYGIKRPKNIFDTPTEQVAKIKSTFNDVLDICGIEPGKQCEPEKSTMARILMLTDGDVDGDDIALAMPIIMVLLGLMLDSRYLVQHEMLASLSSIRFDIRPTTA